jgi:hypothetical protein
VLSKYNPVSGIGRELHECRRRNLLLPPAHQPNSLCTEGRILDHDLTLFLLLRVTDGKRFVKKKWGSGGNKSKIWLVLIYLFFVVSLG